MSAWNDPGRSWSSAHTMAGGSVTGISLTSLLCLCCCALAEKKGTSRTEEGRGGGCSSAGRAFRFFSVPVTRLRNSGRNHGRLETPQKVASAREEKFENGSMLSPLAATEALVRPGAPVTGPRPVQVDLKLVVNWSF